MSAPRDSTRTEDFKRATAGAMRALAHSAEVQVAFQPGPSGLTGKRARLPVPSRALPEPEMQKLRGAADSLALRLRHHDDAIHQRPDNAGVREVEHGRRVDQDHIELHSGQGH